MTVQRIRFGDQERLAAADLLRRFEQEIRPSTPAPEADELPRYLRAMVGIDREHGTEGRLPLEGADELVAAALTGLARIAQHAPASLQLAVADVTSGTALWAMRHELEVVPVEPVVNALANRANAARSPRDAAAVLALMEAVIANVAPRLAADLERSNPERPWRLLHANLAITAIRTGEPALMDRAFDALDRALPAEAPGFYAEALALALNPAVPAAVREKIAQRHARG
ncbi:MAG: hypothetical protein ACM3SO_00960 [Betaproteobacteria bacterium]